MGVAVAHKAFELAHNGTFGEDGSVQESSHYLDALTVVLCDVYWKFLK